MIDSIVYSACVRHHVLFSTQTKSCAFYSSLFQPVMGNCINFGRLSSSKSQSNPSVASPSSIKFSNTHPVTTVNATPSSSGVSSASSTTSALVIKSVAEPTSNANSRFQYIAIFDYDARTKDDLTIRKSDLLDIVSKKNTAWWKAKNEHGQEGWIPSNYVAKRDSLESEPYVAIIDRSL
jgi:hypothetical protein